MAQSIYRAVMPMPRRTAGIAFHRARDGCLPDRKDQAPPALRFQANGEVIFARLRRLEEKLGYSLLKVCGEN
jgi:hypothetical protein